MKLDAIGGIECVHGSLLYSRSKSTRVGCGQSEYSKPYVLFSAIDAASAAIDFSKSNVDDGIVDSPPSRGLRRSPIVSPSLLQGSLCRPRSDHSASPAPRSSNTPHRQLYKYCTDEALLHTPLHVQIRCVFAALPFQVGNINLRSSILDYPRVKDNRQIVSMDDGR